MNQSISIPRCDIVIPVFNGLSDAQECIYSVLAYTRLGSYRLIIINDASDSHTRQLLDKLAVQHPHITLYHNPDHQGLIRCRQSGIAIGDAPFVALVNSDMVVTPGWLDRLLTWVDRDPRIVAVSPLTNSAAWLNLPLAPGTNFFGVDEALQRQASIMVPDFVTSFSGCLLLRRSALECLGTWAAIDKHGVGEAIDLHQRLTACGCRTIVASNVYLYQRNAFAMFTTSRKEHSWPLRVFHRTDPLNPLRAWLTPPRQRWDPVPVIWQTARAMLAARRQHAWLKLLRTAVRGVLRLPAACRPLATPEFVQRFTRPGRLRVTYLLPRLVIAGGVLSVIQLVNQLILLGVEARIAALFEDPAIYSWTPLYAQPLIFRNERELMQNFPDSDLVVATLWSTAPWAAELVQCRRASTAAYFLQDYEPWFFPEAETAAREQVRATYPLIPHRIVKSDWLQQMLARDGYDTHKIRLGMNLDQFYPHDVIRDRPVVLAMARPGTPYRGFEPTIAALAQVKAIRPDVEIRLFGDRNLNRHAIPFAYRDEGVISDQDRLAQVYSAADIFLDGSDFQGFGRCGLEAMACGAATVLTDVGGVNEYARHEGNTLLVPPQRPDRFVEAILRLLDQPELRQTLIKAGWETARQFCHRREAGQTLQFFKSLLTS